MIRAVIDRIVDGKTAVILVGDTEEQHEVDARILPAGSGEGSVLRVRIEGGRIVEMHLDSDDTEQTRQRVREKMNRLRQRGRRR